MILRVPPVVPVELLMNNKEPEQQENKQTYHSDERFADIFDKELEPYGDPEEIKKNYKKNR